VLVDLGPTHVVLGSGSELRVLGRVVVVVVVVVVVEGLEP
jgi:hypothetical protein